MTEDISTSTNPRLPSTDWKKEIETLRERLSHCQTIAAKLKATLEPVSRELSLYKDLLQRQSGAKIKTEDSNG